MTKTYFFLLLGFNITIIGSAQEKMTSKIGQNEAEASVFVLGDGDLAYGLELIYRFSIISKTKIGAGILYGINHEGTYGNYRNGGYGTVFADALQLLGEREKWGVGGQFGKGIYNRDLGFDKLRGGIYYSISGNYRIIISKKLLLTTSLFFGHRNFRYKNTGNNYSLNYELFTGCKLGVVF